MTQEAFEIMKKLFSADGPLDKLFPQARLVLDFSSDSTSFFNSMYQIRFRKGKYLLNGSFANNPQYICLIHKMLTCFTTNLHFICLEHIAICLNLSDELSSSLKNQLVIKK